MIEEGKVDKIEDLRPEGTQADSATLEHDDQGEDMTYELSAEERIRQLEEELEKLKETQLRKAADLENMKKRLKRERDLIFQSSRESAVEAFLPVGDDLSRTIKAMESDPNAAPYLDGVKMVADKFNAVLSRYGVERIDQAGVPFDVHIHDAMLIQKAPYEETESGVVLQVVENGYTMGDKTLRHAKVIVSE